MYWALSIILLLIAGYIIVMNWLVVYYGLTKKKTSYWVPLLGGILGLIGLLLLPIEGAAKFCWVPLVIDYGCILGLVQTALKKDKKTALERPITRTPQGSLRYSTVQISRGRISEEGGDSVLREEIKRITLTYGSPAVSPIGLAVLGLFIICFGIYLGFAPFSDSEFFSKYYTPLDVDNLSGWIILGLFHVLFGGYLVIWSFHEKRYYLLIDAKKGRKKIAFRDSLNLVEISQFIEEARRDFGYDITLNLKDLYEVQARR